ncbi:subtilisin-like protein [Mycena filopes]|nr:subtilisin-like protein [Mycena filopes]
MKLSLLPVFLFAEKTLLIKESVATPSGWTRLGRAPPDRSIRLRIALPQQDFSSLEQSLYEISDPDHPRYGAHMTKEEVEKLVAPTPTSLALVNGWLGSHGLQESDLVRSPAKDWVSATIPIHIAEQMLGTEYYTWQHSGGDVLVRTTDYKLPQYLHDHIELIQPTTMFMRPKGNVFYPDEGAPSNSIKPLTPLTKPHVGPSCAMGITLSCIMQLYNAVGYKPRATKKNAIGITGFLNQYANTQDLASFYGDQLPAAVKSTFDSVSVYGGINNQSLSVAGEEANLDTQFAFGIAFPTPGTFWSTEGTPPFFPDSRTPVDTNEPYLDWLDFILSSNHVVQTISTSYGDDEQTVPLTYARRVCQRFAELGCRGSSVLFASGDGGVGDGNSDPATHQCHTNDGNNTTRFIPGFPAYAHFICDVTAVGGTQDIPEVSAVFSGGGFSDYFQRPPYQHKMLNTYLDKLPHKTYEGLFNRAGRGIPDVSAQSRKFQIVWQGKRISIGGTSASTPAFAGLGLPALGFLNPMLYKYGLRRCGTSGFNATEGWDPITGLGTPNFRKLMDVVV